MSRELGRAYQTRGIELRTDLEGIEHMQRWLTQRFPTRVVASEDDATEAHCHGAFLSEILVRNLGASWIDVTASDRGYWAMVVPPSTKVHPFGRVLRYIAHGPTERDLVSFYLELVAQAGAP
jgi:hypothetical protein